MIWDRFGGVAPWDLEHSQSLPTTSCESSWKIITPWPFQIFNYRAKSFIKASGHVVMLVYSSRMLYRPLTNDVGGVARNWKMRGKVKFWNHTWGMITVDNLTETIFVHWEDLVKTRIDEFRELKKNEFVRFETGEGKDGKTKAINVQRLHVGIFSANDIFEAGKRAGEWLDSTLNPGKFVKYTESSKGIPYIEDWHDAKYFPIEELVKFLDGVEPAKETKELVSRFLQFKLALEQGIGEPLVEFESFLREIEDVLLLDIVIDVEFDGLNDMAKFNEIKSRAKRMGVWEYGEADHHRHLAYPIEQLIELITTKGQDELIERMREWNSYMEADYPYFSVHVFANLLTAMHSVLKAYPAQYAAFKRFLEENEKMISFRATDELDWNDSPTGYHFNPNNNGKYKQLLVDHLRNSPRSENAQEGLLSEVDKLKGYYWNDLEKTKEVSWIEYIRKEVRSPHGLRYVGTQTIYCCIMALEFVEVTEFDRPGGCLLDLVDFSSEVELVGKYDIEVTALKSDPSDKFLVTDNGLTVLEDYRKRRIETGLVSEAEEFIKSKLGTMAVGGLTKIYFLAHCDKSSDLFQKLGYTLVTKYSSSVQDLRIPYSHSIFDFPDPGDELSEHWLNETTA